MTVLPPINMMTVDVEEWFQVQALEPAVKRASWDQRRQRVEDAAGRVLDLFAAADVRATFFTLGWVAQRRPRLVRRIVDAGHELASHGVDHMRADRMAPDAFRRDVRDSKRMLEDVGGTAVRGYRAPSFSIKRSAGWIYDILAEEGYRYSSSLHPIRHDIYGDPDAPRFAYETPAGIREIPITTARVGGRNLPCGGGGWFRMAPYAWSRYALRRTLVQERQPLMFYFHPWEIDPDQPRLRALPLRSRLRHYVGLSRMERKLARLLRDFRWGRVDEVVPEITQSIAA